MKTNLENKSIDPASDPDDELRPEYTAADFKKRVRGKYAGQFSEETHMVVLAPDVAQAFPTAEAVHAALRSLLPQNEDAAVNQ